MPYCLKKKNLSTKQTWSPATIADKRDTDSDDVMQPRFEKSRTQDVEGKLSHPSPTPAAPR